MPLILLGTDRSDESLNDDKCAQVLRSRGFTVDSGFDLIKVPSILEVVASSGGKVDAVVLHATQPTSNPLIAAESIRRLSPACSFRKAVRACTVPIVIVSDVMYAESPINMSWLGALSLRSLEVHPEALMAEVFGVISGWRQSLLRELDYAGYAVTISGSGQLKISHALVRKSPEGEILTSEATPGSLRSGQFLMLAEDVLQEFAPYKELRYLLNNYRLIAKSEGIKPEAVFQKFFEEHPHLIKRELFDAHWSQPTLRVPGESGAYFRPDFVFRPRVGAEIGTKWQIMDLKLPDDQLVVSRAFHARLSANFTKAVQQLEDYRDYFNRPDAEEELVHRFGMRPQNPRLAVLIGRRSEIQDPEVLSRVQARFLDVELLTYDEIVDLEAERLALNSALASVF